MGLLDFVKRKQPDPVLERDRADLLRHYEILKDCENLINNSPSFATVVSRYDLMLDELGYFAAWEAYGVDYLQRYGCSKRLRQLCGNLHLMGKQNF